MFNFRRRGLAPSQSEALPPDETPEKGISLSEFRDFLQTDTAFDPARMNDLKKDYADRTDRLPGGSPACERLGAGARGRYRPHYPLYNPDIILKQREVVMRNDRVGALVNRTFPSSSELARETGSYTIKTISQVADGGPLLTETAHHHPAGFRDYYAGIALTAEYGRAIASPDFRRDYASHLADLIKEGRNPGELLESLAPVTDYLALCVHHREEYAAYLGGMRGAGGMNPYWVTYAELDAARAIAQEERESFEKYERIVSQLQAVLSEKIMPTVDQVPMRAEHLATLQEYLTKFSSGKYDAVTLQEDILPKHIFVRSTDDTDLPYM